MTWKWKHFVNLTNTTSCLKLFEIQQCKVRKVDSRSSGSIPLASDNGWEVSAKWEWENVFRSNQIPPSFSAYSLVQGYT